MDEDEELVLKVLAEQTIFSYEQVVEAYKVFDWLDTAGAPAWPDLNAFEATFLACDIAATIGTVPINVVLPLN